MDYKILKTQKKTAVLLSTFIAAASLSFLPTASAADGDLDNTFDTDGRLTTAIGAGFDGVFSAILQSDGKIVVAGYSYNGANNDFALARYNTNGSLDTSFDTDGKLTTAIGAGEDAVFSAILQSDGKIVVAGYSYNGANNDFALARYNTNGSLDTSFDTDGKLTTDFGASNDQAQSAILQSDGKIVVAGYANNGGDVNFALARYNTDGSLDTSFDTDGKLTTIIGTFGVATSVILQSDGKILAAGYSVINGANADFALARYNTDGSLDTSFDTDGKLTTAIGASEDEARSVILQSDGKIVVAGDAIGAISDFALARYNTDGSLDTSFDTDGKLTTDFGASNDQARSVILQSDGKIVVAGYSYNGANNDFALARYNTNGSLDTSFDTDGKLTTAIGAGDDLARSAILQSDGKIVVAGQSHNGSNYDFAVVRYIASNASEAAAEAARVAAAAEAARVAAAAEAAKKAKEQKELTELLSVIPSIAGLALNIGDLTNSLLTTKCVKKTQVRYVKKGAKCPKGFVKRK